MINRKTLIILLIVGAVLLLAAGAAYFLFISPAENPISRLEITPPPSLDDVAEQYPELATILNDPALGSVYKEFLIAYQEGGEEAAADLARERGLLTPDGDVRVTLVLDTEDNAPLVNQLEAAGVNVVSAYRDRVNISVPMELIQAQLENNEADVIFEQLTELEHVIAVRLPERNVPQGSEISGEGAAVIGAELWHEAGLTGAGIRIGVLDMGFSGYEALLGTELPKQVTLETFGWIEEDSPHGTACAEIIHEIAPDAELIFAWYDGSDAAMGEAADWLIAQEVDIISHSAGGLIGPRDGSEWKAQLVDEVAAQGILWVNAAGNEGIAHYQGVFTDEDGDGLHEFVPGEEMMALPNRGYVEIFLMWDDWTQATQDYELFLVDAAGNTLAVSEEPQSGEEGQWPVEGIILETGGETVYAAVEVYEADRAVMLDIFVYPIDLAVQYQEPAYSICPPSDAVGSLTVGAANWWDDSLAYYSSQGPTGDGRLKPEISAPTAVTGASYGPSEAHNEDAGFNGTSAACPHVAGTAALIWHAHPQFSRQEVVDYLLAHAVDLGPSGADTGYGYGRLQLPQEVPAPSSAPSPTLAAATPAPVSTPTPVAYITPTPPLDSPEDEETASVLGLTGLILIVGGAGCVGVGLLLMGGIGLLVLGRRARQAPPTQHPTPQAAPQAPAPRPPTPKPQRVRCEFCGAEARPGARFCKQCGNALPQWGNALPQGDNALPQGDNASPQWDNTLPQRGNASPQAGNDLPQHEYSPAADRQPRFCRHCGAPLKEEARFCPRCGEATTDD